MKVGFWGTNINLSENIAAKQIGDAQIDEISRQHLEKGEINNELIDLIEKIYHGHT